MPPGQPDAVYLGLDTATPYLSLALWSPLGGTLAAFAQEVGREHAKRLLPELQALCERAGVAPTMLRGVVAGTGPGSYTGLRVGLASAQGLARGLGVGLSGSSTLAAIAARGLEVGQTGVAALDARRGNVYGAVYRRSAAGLVTVAEATKAPREALQQSYPEAVWLEGLAPDAAYLAQRFAAGEPPLPQYL